MLTVKSHLRTTTTADGAAVLDIERGVITTLNSIGAYIWKRLGMGDQLEGIVTELSRETGENPKIIERDVAEFVASLVTQGWIANETSGSSV